MITVLGLLAKAGHGKTSVANYLKQNYGVKIVSFATPLKRVCKTVMNFSDDQLYGSQAAKEAIDPRYGFSARTFMQLLGTEGLRKEFGWDIHVKAMFHQLERDDEDRDRDYVYVIDDMRFENEVRGIVQSDDVFGYCIKIVCTDAPDTAGVHASETEIDKTHPALIVGTVVSSRAQGVPHLISEFERVLRNTPRLSRLCKELDDTAPYKG